MYASSPRFMDDSSEKRYSSLSDSTLVGSENGLGYQHVDSSIMHGQRPGRAPTILYSDIKDWAPVAIDALPPKLVRELGGDGFPEDDPQRPTSRGESRAKAWIGSSPFGFVFRLRKKISEKIERVIDTEVATGPGRKQARKQPSVVNLSFVNKDTYAELGSTPLHEAPDNAVIPELSSNPVHELPTIESILPTYEQSRANASTSPVEKPSQPAEQSASHATATSDGPVSPLLVESSYTPDEHAMHRRSSDAPASEDLALNQSPPEESSSTIAALEAHLDETRSQLREEQKVNDEAKKQLKQEIKKKEEIELLLADLQQQLSKQGKGKLRGDDNQIGGLRIVGQKRYEIETDVEPPSLSDTSDIRNLRSKPSALSLRRKKDPSSSKSFKERYSPTSSDERSNDSDGEGEKGGTNAITGTGKGTYPRRRTAIKKLSLSIEKEALLMTLLRVQAEILGPEHRLTAKARLERPRNPREWESRRLNGLVAVLREGGHEAKSKHGDDNARVKTFFADLRTFEELVRRPEPLNVEEAADKSEDSASSANVSLKGEADNDTQEAIALTEGAQAIERQDQPLDSLSVSTHSRSDPEKLESAIPVTPNDVTYQISNDGGFVMPSRPYEPRPPIVVFTGLVLNALMKMVLGVLRWLQLHYGTEPPLAPGKVRVRWACTCGERLYDDFTELRPGAARALEVFLNRPRVQTHTYGNASSGSSGSTNSSRGLTGSSLGALSQGSSSTAPSSIDQQTSNDAGNGGGSSSDPTKTPMYPTSFFPLPPPLYLLVVASEDRYTTKMTHVDVGHVASDMDLGRALREHYAHVNRRWWRNLRLRGVASIKFVQFEVHRNRYADIRKCPDVPPLGHKDYAFDPVDPGVYPPIGEKQLLHIFQHPEQYDTELMASLRAPKKKTGRLMLGVGWGLHLVEDFRPERVAVMMGALVFFASLAFAVAWACERHDVQGAFGVAQWISGMAAFGCLWVQLYVG